MRVYGIGSGGGYASGPRRDIVNVLKQKTGGHAVHNWNAEKDWIAELNKKGRIKHVC